MLNFNVIIVTTDLSEYSLRALPYAVGLAERFDAELKLWCVAEPAIQVSDVAFVGVDPVLSRRQHIDVVSDALASGVIWAGVYALVESDWLSFRSGWLALPER